MRRDLLELRREQRVGEDLAIPVDPLDGVAEGDLLLRLRQVKKATWKKGECEVIRAHKMTKILGNIRVK